MGRGYLRLALIALAAILAWCVLMAAVWGVTQAFAFPHYDRPGYHHCPITAKVGPGDCHEGGHSELSSGETVLAGLAPDLRRDFDRWLHPHHHRDECRRLHEAYFMRHGFGRPADTRGHGCTLWRNDAQYHEHHADAPSLLQGALTGTLTAGRL